jgi:hypothetical protein
MNTSPGIEVRKREPSSDWKTLATPPTLEVARKMLEDIRSVSSSGELAIFVDGARLTR